MGLSNASSKARNYSSTINQNQGGGSKKAGFPFMIGRTANISRQFGVTDVKNGHCCGLKLYQTTFVFANITRNIGRQGNSNYWKMPGIAK